MSGGSGAADPIRTRAYLRRVSHSFHAHGAWCGPSPAAPTAMGPGACDTAATNSRRTARAAVGGPSVGSPRGYPGHVPERHRRIRGRRSHSEVSHDQTSPPCPCPHRRHGGLLASRVAKPDHGTAAVDAGFEPGRKPGQQLGAVAVVLLGPTLHAQRPPGFRPRGSFFSRINAMRRRRLCSFRPTPHRPPAPALPCLRHRPLQVPRLSIRIRGSRRWSRR
jgi:hypothetical protein